MISRTTLLAGFALAGACSAASARAQAPSLDDRVREEHVSFSDLDLTRPAGAKTLMSRLHGAANDVCGRWEESVEPSARAAVTACVRAAVARAVKQVDQPELTALLDNEPAIKLALVPGPRR